MIVKPVVEPMDRFAALVVSIMHKCIAVQAGAAAVLSIIAVAMSRVSRGVMVLCDTSLLLPSIFTPLL